MGFRVLALKLWRLALGQRHTVAEGRRGQAPGTASGAGHFSRQAGRFGDRSRCDSSLQCDPPDIGGQGGPIALQAGGWSEGQRRGGNLEWAGDDHQLGSLATGGHADPEGGLKREGLANEVQKLLHSF